MAVSDIKTIIRRIRGATKRSPIAVFNTPEGLDAVFGATIDSLIMIEEEDSLVGVFDNSMNMKEIKKILESYNER